MSKDELSSKIGLQNPEQKKPLLMQLLEGFISNDKPSGKAEAFSSSYENEKGEKNEPVL